MATMTRGKRAALAARAVQDSSGEDLFAYIARVSGGFEPGLYRRVVGAANALKEGDEIVGVSAEDEAARAGARRLLGRTRIAAIDAHPLFEDDLYRRILEARDGEAAERTAAWTLDALKAFL